jgi:hypothetical protein
MQLTRVGAAFCVALCACAQTAYPAPPPRALPSTVARAPATPDDGDRARIAELEKACRTHLAGATAEASLGALDRVHEVLGASCEIATVGRDPLHWLLRCRSDALFGSGRYVINSGEEACPELANSRTTPLQCLGAVLQTLLSREQSSALEELGIAVIGHVDMQPLRASSDAHLCTSLLNELGYTPSVPWAAVPDAASDEERAYANDQLAFCRAASVTQALQNGMARAGKLAKSASADGAQRVDIAVLGVGASWLGSQPSGQCPSTGQRYQAEHACVDARRVDLLLRFTPRLQATSSHCALPGDDPANALTCLERCYDEAAIDDRSAQREQSTPLFSAGAAADTALPAGFYLQQLGRAQDRHLELARVCQTLGIDRAHCPVR